MADLRSCDLCAAVRPRGALWHFVTDGKSDPSDWVLPQHWCPECMKAIREFVSHLAA